MQKTNWIIVACLLAFIGVALGAFGAHGLKETLAVGQRAGWWSTAVDYHMWHVMGILFAGLLHERRGRGAGAALAFSVGILIFSGSLYAMALGAPSWFGAVTPIGGLGFLVGWILLGLAARRVD